MLRKVMTLGGLSFVVAGLTYLQSRLLLQSLGASALLDSYYLAMTLPMALSTIAGVVLVALVVPEYSRELRETGTLSGVWRVGFAVTGGLLLLQVCAAVLSVLLAFWDSAMLAQPSWLALMLVPDAVTWTRICLTRRPPERLERTTPRVSLMGS